MNCKQAKTEIALSAGGDLDEGTERSLRRHLATCPHCREHRQSVQSALHLLQDPENVPVNPVNKVDDSVWPGLVKHLPTREDLRRADRLNRWLPAAAAVVACLAVVAFTADPYRPGPRRGLDGMPFETPPISLESPPLLGPSRVEGPPEKDRLQRDRFGQLDSQDENAFLRSDPSPNPRR